MTGRDTTGESDRHLRLTHPDLDFHVDVQLRPYGSGTWIATADLGSEHDVGVDKDPRRAIAKSLASLGERRAREMAESADLES